MATANFSQCCAFNLPLSHARSEAACALLPQTGEEGEEVMADFKCKLYRSASSCCWMLELLPAAHASGFVAAACSVYGIVQQDTLASISF